MKAILLFISVLASTLAHGAAPPQSKETKEGKGIGLLAAYHDRPNFKGRVIYRIDEAINFNWGMNRPMFVINRDYFSIRWTGEIEPPATGEYTFTLLANDGGLIKIGKVEVGDFNATSAMPPSGKTNKIKLEGGKRYPVQVDFFDNNGVAAVSLSWSGPGIPMSVVPTQYLFPVQKGKSFAPNQPKTGLLGAYYQNRFFYVDAALKVDAKMDFAPVTPPQKFPDKNYSVRWTGQIMPPHDGEYTFKITTDLGVRLWVDGRLVVNELSNRKTQTFTGTATLRGGRRLNIRIESVHRAGQGILKVVWSSKSMPEKVLGGDGIFPTFGSTLIDPYLTMRQAEKGDRQAQLDLANIYWEGSAFPQNLEKASKWYKKAAEDKAFRNNGLIRLRLAIIEGVNEGDAQSQYLFASASPEISPTSLELLLKAAAQDHKKAFNALTDRLPSILRNKGTYPPEMLKDLYPFLVKAAQTGNPQAQLAVAESYASGMGLPKDNIQALKWYIINGWQSRPHYRIAGLKKELEAEMTAAEKAQARKEADSFLGFETVDFSKPLKWKNIQNKASDLIDQKTGQAIAGALRYLASTQKPDGSWGESSEERRHPIATTAYVLRAFQAAGHNPASKGYGKTVDKGLKYLLDQLQDDGIYGKTATGQYMYHHGIATTVLAEYYTQTKSPLLKAKLQRAIKLIAVSQNPQGGWRYRPRVRDADISVTGLQVQALCIARAAGIKVPLEVMEKAMKYIKACRHERSGGFSYQPGSSPGFARTAIAINSLLALGLRDDPMVAAGAKYLFANLRENQEWFVYAVSFASPAMHVIGDDMQKAWYTKIKPIILKDIQSKGVPINGKEVTVNYWNPKGRAGVGPIFTTAIYTKILAQPYGHILPPQIKPEPKK